VTTAPRFFSISHLAGTTRGRGGEKRSNLRVMGEAVLHFPDWGSEGRSERLISSTTEKGRSYCVYFLIHILYFRGGGRRGEKGKGKYHHLGSGGKVKFDALFFSLPATAQKRKRGRSHIGHLDRQRKSGSGRQLLAGARKAEGQGEGGEAFEWISCDFLPERGGGGEGGEKVLSIKTL